LNSSRASRLLSWAPFILLSFGPIVYLLHGALRGEDGYTLEAFTRTLFDSSRLRLMANSLKVGVGVLVASLLVGVPYGFLVGRSDLRGRALYHAIAIVPLLVPTYIAGIAWTEFAPIGGFQQIDCDVEDAARMSIGGRRAFVRVTLALARPALISAMLLVFVLAVSDFSVPDFFSFAGVQEGSFQVLATDVYFHWATQADPASSTAAAVPLIVLALVCMLFVGRLESRRSHRSVGGSFRRPRPFRLGFWQLPAHAFLLLVLAFSVGVPVGVMVRWAFFDPRAVLIDPTRSEELFTQQLNFIELLQGPAGGDLWRSVGYSAAAAVLLLALSIGLGARLTRGRSGGALAWILLPLGFPSLLVSMAQVELFNHPGSVLDPFYGGGGLVILSMVARFFPVAILGLRAAWSRIDESVEEATRLSISSLWVRWIRVRLPLLTTGLVTTGLLCFVLAMRELDVVVLLDGAQRMLPMRIYNKVHYARDTEVAALCLIQLGAILLPWSAVQLLLPRRRTL
jgi:iron(III) transport system permease protein